MLVHKYFLLFLSFMCIWTISIGQVKIHGKILSGTFNAPIENATINLKVDGRSSITDMEGKFDIELNMPDTLIVSHIGYLTKSFPVSDVTKGQVTIRLEYARDNLEEVIVNTGYQQLPKERATGSFEVIDNELFNRNTSENVLERLDGRVPGLIINKGFHTSSQEPDISIRGISSIESSTQPLIILNSFPYKGSINNINPNDIETITILKDAAAASIWGTKAGNGVIVITTKSGNYNKEAVVSINSNLSIKEKPDLFYIPQFSSSDFIDIEMYLFDKGFYDGALINTNRWPVVSPVVEILERRRKGLVSSDVANDEINSFRKYNYLKDMDQYLYRKSIKQQYAASLTGGSSHYNYLFSAGFDKVLNNEIGNENNRLTLRLTNTLMPLSKLELKFGATYTQNNVISNSEINNISPAVGKNSLFPYARLVDVGGAYLSTPKDYRNSLIDTIGAGNLLDWHYYPLKELDLNDNENKTNDIILNFAAKYYVFNTLKAVIKFQYERANSNTRIFRDKTSYYVRNLINLYTPTGGKPEENSAVPYGDILDVVYNDLKAYDIRGQLSYDNMWNGIHALNLIGGVEASESRNALSSNRTYGYDDDVETFRNVDFVGYHPTYDLIRGNSSVIPNNKQFETLTNRSISVFFNGSYTFKDRYTLSSSVRRDASNVFGVSTNNKWKPLWSIGASWEISKEKFFNSSLFSYLKLRITHGFSGNVNNSQSARLTLYNIGTNYFNLPTSTINNPPNPALRWEQVEMNNIGLDYSTKSNRLSGKIEAYIKKSTDLISGAPADLTTGYQSLTRNTAALEGKGIDFSLNSLNLNGKFKWKSNLNFSYNVNTVSKYLLKPPSLSAYVGNGSNINPIQGELAYSLFSYKWAGLDPENGDPRSYLNGKISKDYSKIANSVTLNDLAMSGSVRPLIFGNLSNTFHFINMTFSFNVIYSMLYYYRRPNTMNYGSLYNGWVGTAYSDYLIRWQKPGDEVRTNVPSMIYPSNSLRDQFYQYSETTVEPGDNIRLQNIRVGYDLISTDTKKYHSKPFKQLTFYINATNLGILWKKSNFKLDPDYEIPPPVQFTFGMTATF